MVNKAILVGNLGVDPELRYTNSGSHDGGKNGKIACGSKPKTRLLAIFGGFMSRDLRNEGWGPEDCYPDGAYAAEQRRNKIEWWKRIAAKTGWPDGGVYIVMRDTDYDAGKDDMVLKHETGVEIPFRIDDGETIKYIADFFGEVFPSATIIGGDDRE